MKNFGINWVRARRRLTRTSADRQLGKDVRTLGNEEEEEEKELESGL